MTLQDWINRVEATCSELRAISIGACPGCERCRDLFASDMGMDEFEDAWSSCEICDEPAFDTSECGICGSGLGGDRWVWHWLDDNNEIMHEDDACIDCVMYICNGELPTEYEDEEVGCIAS